MKCNEKFSAQLMCRFRAIAHYSLGVYSKHTATRAINTLSYKSRISSRERRAELLLFAGSEENMFHGNIHFK